MAKIYLTSSNSARVFLVSQEPSVIRTYLVTDGAKKLYITSKEFEPVRVYFSTPSSVKVYFNTANPPNPGAYVVTVNSNKVYFNTEPLDASSYPNICYYPKKLDIIRQKATLLIWDIIKKKLYSSLTYEGWGKINTRGYFSAGNVRLLLDYLSSIWLERDNDSRSGLVRTSDYYYTKYNINDIIVNFRNCDINIKPIVALFDLNSYSVIDGNWPNYFIINNILNPPTEEALKTLKQYTDIFTLDALVTANSGQSKYTIAGAQTNFPLTKTLKYITSFVINGSDYIGYIDYNYTTVTYSPSVLNGYTITSSDTVTITYWYEE
jgi:hypothetical protein